MIRFLGDDLSCKVENSTPLPACHPQEDKAFILQVWYLHLPHLVILHSTVRQLHVNIPGRVGHDYCKLAQDIYIYVSDVALDPLQISTWIEIKFKLLWWVQSQVSSNFNSYFTECRVIKSILTSHIQTQMNASVYTLNMKLYWHHCQLKINV